MTQLYIIHKVLAVLCIVALPKKTIQKPNKRCKVYNKQKTSCRYKLRLRSFSSRCMGPVSCIMSTGPLIVAFYFCC